jgi:mono/diheme cytochrome c family protein
MNNSTPILSRDIATPGLPKLCVRLLSNRSISKTPRVVLFLAVIWLGVLLTNGQAKEPPFVSGFDRFFATQAEPSPIAGQLLMTELSCAACHESKDSSLTPKRGPRLQAVGLRLQQDWLMRFLSNPSQEKPGTTMPDVLHALDKPEKELTIKALTAFLATQTEAFPTLVSTASNPVAIEFWNKGDRQRGKALFHQVGCVACHEPSDDQAGSEKQTQLEKILSQLEPDEIKALGLSDAAVPIRSVPHAKLIDKYTRKSLTHFLIRPDLIRPHGRMPSLKLNATEAADISAHLLREQSVSVALSERQSKTDATLIAQGANLFSQFKCVACHDIRDSAKIKRPSFKKAKQLADLDAAKPKSCVSNPSNSQPSFSFDVKQSKSILAAMKQLNQADKSIKEEGNTQSTSRRDVEFKMMQLNCFACHEREKKGGVGVRRRRFFETAAHVDLGDEGRIPPSLDHVGYKLKASWLKSVFNGTGDIRPHLLARMPHFPEVVTNTLPSAFTSADRTKTKPTPEFQNAAKLVSAGRELLDTGCVQCHTFRGERLPGVMGTDIANVDKRINPDWFREFLLNPASMKNRTRMPTFFPNGRSSNKTVLNGNVDQQIAAIWGYINEPNKLPLPAKIVAGKIHNFEVKPKDRPVVLRTFMKDAGTHAIAVGFPQGVHLAFDAERVQLAQIWKGKFLDAHGTWYDRFTPLATPLGTNIITLTKRPLIASLKTATTPWPAEVTERAYRFRGYRLDKSGTPTFLYSFETLQIQDRIEPLNNTSIQRTITFIQNDAERMKNVWLLANSGKLSAVRTTGYKNAAGLTVELPEAIAEDAVLRNSAHRQEWIVPISGKQEISIKMTYTWANP